MRLTRKPEKITELLESLLRTDHFDLLARIIGTEASDFKTLYCNIWKSADISDLFYKIWDGYDSGAVDRQLLRDLMLPECISKSYFTILNMSKEMIQSLPHSMLQAKDFPFNLLRFKGSVLEEIIRKAIYDQPQDPKIKWSNWIMNDLDFAKCPKSSIYYNFAWQLITPNEYLTLPEYKANCFIEWLLLETDSDFMKISDEEALIRTLTLISWKSYTTSSALFTITRRINQRAYDSAGVVLIKDLLKLGGPNDPEWNLNVLFRVISCLETNVIFVGDWFIGILGLWQSVLKSLVPDKFGLRILDKILQFVLFTLQPTFQGVTRLPELFDSSMRSFIEKRVYERFKNEIKYFYREYPTFFEEKFTLIHLNIRITTFLRKKRVFSSSHGPFLLNSDFDMNIYRANGAKDFMLFIGDRIRNGVEDLSRTSLNAALFSFAGTVLSFKSMTKLFLLSFSEIPDWIQVKRINEKDYLIPTPYCPNLMWELLGYFLIQARILNIKIDFVLDKKFFLEMINPIDQQKYIKRLSEIYRESQKNEIRILSMNFMDRFTVASVTSLDDYSTLRNSPIECQNLVFELFRKGMECMRKGFAHVLESTKFTPEELYKFIFNE